MSEEIVLDDDCKPEIFSYLDGLRESGVTNMNGSPAYLEEEFGMPFKEACAYFHAWWEQFSK